MSDPVWWCPECERVCQEKHADYWPGHEPIDLVAVYEKAKALCALSVFDCECDEVRNLRETVA